MEKDDVRRIFVDFEWHKIPKGKVRCEIIEFGAVMLDKDKQEMSRFKRYVKPRYVNTISKHIQELTGITNGVLEDADWFEVVLDEFLNWCEGDSKIHEGAYVIYSWSESDLLQINEEMKLKGVEESDSIRYMKTHWYDLQQEFDSTLGFERQVSLKDALYAAGIDFEGTAHDAVDDAANTSVLYRFLQDPEKQNTIIKTIQSALCPEPDDTTLGDLIDWSQFAGFLQVG